MLKKNAHELSTFLYSFLFILLYGSGFVGAKLGFPYAKPLVFLSLRFLVSTLLLLIIAFLVKASWPKSWKEAGHIAVSGCFLVGLFSIGTWISMDMGVSPAISALIIALQPLCVAIGAHFFLSKRVGVVQWFGLMLGLIGIIMIVEEKANFSSVYLTGVLMSFVGLIGLTVGNLYQKKFCSSMNIFTGGVIQSVVSGLICFLGAIVFEPMRVIWSGQFIFALSWMSVVISLGAISFLYILLSRGESHKVASLFYLVPVATAIIAYFVFGSYLDRVELFGILITMCGVALVNVKGFKKRADAALE